MTQPKYPRDDLSFGIGTRTFRHPLAKRDNDATQRCASTFKSAVLIWCLILAAVLFVALVVVL